mmetsp:Transcript_17025/g.28716  ORF Transcript_17025/g.28716 Transcript_17025/m.28716 type:complete len:227 (+) Transcript_17025:462-1142(+)
MPHHGRVALRVGKLIAVNVADAPDDCLVHGVLVHFEAAQEVAGAVVVVHGGQQVGVAVREVREHAAVGVEVAEPAVRATRHAHAVPQPRSAQVLGDHKRRAAELVPRLVQVAGLAHVVHLGGHDQALVAALHDLRPLLRHTPGGGQRGQEGVEGRVHGREELLLPGHVQHGALPGDHSGADRLEVFNDPLPVVFDTLNKLASEVEVADAAHLLVDPAGGAVHGVQA